MPSRRSRFFSLLSGISFLLLIAVYALWLPSAGAPAPYELSWKLFGDRYTLRSHRGWLSLCRPPAITENSAVIASAIAPLTNDNIEWTIQGRPTRRAVIRSQSEMESDPGFTPTGCAARVVAGGTVYTLPKTDAALSRPLLDALEDERRFAVAHVLLHQQYGKTAPKPTVRMEASAIRVSFDGLEAEVKSLPLPPKPQFPTTNESRAQPMAIRSTLIDAGQATIDPAQLPRIRQHWHDLLDVTVLAAPHAALMGMFLICPMIWAVRLRRRLRWGSAKAEAELTTSNPAP
jgi:hypothetical protein